MLQGVATRYGVDVTPPQSKYGNLPLGFQVAPSWTRHVFGSSAMQSPSPSGGTDSMLWSSNLQQPTLISELSAPTPPAWWAGTGTADWTAEASATASPACRDNQPLVREPLACH